MRSIFMALIIFTGVSSVGTVSASACEAAGGGAMECGIKCYSQPSFIEQAVCAIMAPSPFK